MNPNSQHEFHPDAEQLNAFAEHALSEHERRQMLAHLAGCVRCRQVLAYAQQAADISYADEAELDVAAEPALAAAFPPSRTSSPQKPWWRSWRFAWAPAACLAAGASLAFYIHFARVERNSQMAANATPESSHYEAAAKSAPQGPAKPKSTPPTPSVAHPSQNLIAGSAGAVTATQKVASRSTVQLPRPAATDRVVVLQAAPAIEANSLRPVPPIEPQLAVGSPTVYKVPLPMPPAQQQAQARLQKKSYDVNGQAVTAAATDQVFAAGANPAPVGQSANDAITANAAAPLNSQNQLVGSRNRTVAALGTIRGTQAAIPRIPILLPSGLTAASIASADHHILAIDNGGALFLSHDRGITWQPVASQWTGRAVLVRSRTVPVSGSTTGPTAEVDSKSSGAMSTASAPATFFEIVNDKNEIWVSTDGTVWTAK